MNQIYQPGQNTDETLIYKGLVVSVPDSLTGFEPIRCRIQVLDSMIYQDKDLPLCYPLLPKHLSVYPKVGEYVYIITLAKGKVQQNRYFLGPVIDTYKNLPYNPDDNTETNASVKSKLNQPEKGIYPSRNHISIQGRNNSDVVFRDQEVLIRAGKYVANNPLKYNSLDTAYIQIRYGEPSLKQVNKTITTREVKLITPEGFITANLTNVVNPNYNFIVDINVEDGNNNFIGRIYKTFGQRNESISYIKQTFINLQRNDTDTKILIRDNQNNQIDINRYDFSKYKFINSSITELKDFDISQLKETKEVSKTVPTTETVFTDSKGSSLNVVGSKINLISHGNKNGFKLLDPDLTITAEEQLKINTDAQPIPYGYVLNDFLNLVKSFVANHVHAYPGLPPDPDPIVNKILNFDLESILNQNVRTA